MTDMATLLLKLSVYLQDPNLRPLGPFSHHGPLFSKWLPDGESDAIVLNPDADATLKLWFERHGFTDEHGFIRFDYQRREVDSGVMERQALLSAGPLKGLLELRGLSDGDLRPVLSDDKGDPQYIALGKKVVMLLFPHIDRLLSTLRANFGQYWILPLEKWDYREETLGHYCSRLGLSWSINGREWSFFRPTDIVVHITGRVSQYTDYLRREDWKT